MVDLKRSSKMKLCLSLVALASAVLAVGFVASDKIDRKYQEAMVMPKQSDRMLAIRIPGVDGVFSNEPTASPTATPSQVPSGSPSTKSPTSTPTIVPTDKPTEAPFLEPTFEPTQADEDDDDNDDDDDDDDETISPTESPSDALTFEPTTQSPTSDPTERPTSIDPESETIVIILTPAPRPSSAPPTPSPSVSLTSKPLSAPPTPSPSTEKPTVAPTSPAPTSSPSTESPTPSPSTDEPTAAPTRMPSIEPADDDSSSSNTISPSSTQSPISMEYVPGNLAVQENGLLLSQGLTARIFAESGGPVVYASGEESEDGCHEEPDFGAVFVDTRPENTGGWVYVSNSEVSDGDGGVAAFIFNADGNVIEYRPLLSGTSRNCGGGRTPWGTWVSCEEDENGQCHQVHPLGEREPEVITLGNDGGNFESFTVDLREGQPPVFFITEDSSDGALQRFIPDVVDWTDPWTMLHGTGTRDFLLLDPETRTFSWTTDRDEAMGNAEAFYPNSEGIECIDGVLYFVSKAYRTIYTLTTDASGSNGTYVAIPTDSGVFEGEPDQIVHVAGPGGVIYFTEDGGDRAGIHARDSQGRYFTILEGIDEGDETTGLAFSPDHKHLYFALQHQGLLFDVTRLDGLPFLAETLNVRYHANYNRRL